MTEYAVTWLTGVKRIRTESRMMQDGSLHFGYLDENDVFHATSVMAFPDGESRQTAYNVMSDLGYKPRVMGSTTEKAAKEPK